MLALISKLGAALLIPYTLIAYSYLGRICL